MDTLLGVILLLGGGIAAGVLFSVALSVVPAFVDLPADRYVELHKLVGRRYDRVMPAVVLTCTALDVGLVFRVSHEPSRALFILAALLGAGVAAVSQLGNVPINRRVKSLPAGAVPTDWVDPRPRWRALNLVRTNLAVCGLVVNACALLLAR
jgi:uncharacterized membrane protein